MSCTTLFLIVLVPVIALGYAAGEYLEIWDKITKRKLAVEGLARLKLASGFPNSWIFDDEKDIDVFIALEKRISKKTKEDKIIKVLAEGHKPSLITVGGAPINLVGVPAEWPDECKRVYMSNHPIMYCFNVSRNEPSNGKCDKVCTIAELEKWLQEEKENRKFWIGAVVLGLLSTMVLILRSLII